MLAARPELRSELERQWADLNLVDAMLATTRGPRLPSVPGFAVLGVLGYGGTGVVYRARQLSLSREALKLMLGGRFASERMRERFRREAETVARLQHSHIAQVHDHGELDGLPYLVQELVRGGTLADRIGAGEHAPRAAAELVEILAQAVQYAHAAGIIHRDLKPSNVLMTETGQPKIADFGLAKLADDRGGLTGSGETPGTPSYMAPEQISAREVSPATDVYALGAILYEMLTGRLPFDSTSVSELYGRFCASRRGSSRWPRCRATCKPSA